MTQPTRSDRDLSVVASEFVWDIDGPTEVHGYVAPHILGLLGSHSAQKVLDLGCGNGSLTGLIAGHGFEVVGMDRSDSGLELAQRNFPSSRFVSHDVTTPLPEVHARCYDAVIAVEVIEHLLLPRMLLQNAAYALKPGGLLIVTTPFHGYLKNLALALTNKFDSHWHPLRDYGHVKFFSRNTLIQIVSEAGFLDIDFTTTGRIPPLARSMIVSGKLSP